MNGIENAVVLLSYPAKSFGKEKALRAFISTNAALSDEEILDLYVVRWEIEVYFRDCKMKLAVDKYQIRSANGIKHFWLIASLASNQNGTISRKDIICCPKRFEESRSLSFLTMLKTVGISLPFWRILLNHFCAFSRKRCWDAHL